MEYSLKRVIMKPVSFLILVAMLLFISLPVHAVDSDMAESNCVTLPDGTQRCTAELVAAVTECGNIGADVQAAAGGGVKILALDPGGLLEGIGLQLGDVIFAVDGIATNDSVSFCTQIENSKGQIVQLIVKDINSGNFFIIKVEVPA